jgi:hypothetical protein
VVGGLAVTLLGGQLVLTIGDDTLERVSLTSPDAGEACAYRLRVGDGMWSLEGGATGAASGGSLDAMPVVTGLFSAIDLRTGSAPSIDVTTTVHATEVTLRQTLAWVIAVLGIVGALFLVTFDRRPRRLLPSVRDAFREAWRHAHLTDGVVAIVLVGWLVLSPVFWDDGWVVARERAFSTSGGFSTYYNAFGVNLPLDYWVEWLQHWVTQSSTALPLLRLPSLLCLAAVWVLCRWAFVRVSGTSRSWSDVALWTLAATFLAGALAWGMTLRPEPVTALLATGVMACAFRFSERESTAPVVAAALLVPLAVTAHHTGIVALAPAIAVTPQLFSWARRRLAACFTIVTASFALLVVLAFVGSDLGQRLADARTTRESGITQAWRDELGRYVLLGQFPFGAPLRRGSVALIVLAILAYAVRRRRDARAIIDLPATTLAIALVLFILTPSKLPWHFGALIGIAALAVAAETVRLREDAARFRGWQPRPFLIVGAAVASAAWSWWPRESWNPVDLRTVGWTPGLDALLPFSQLAVVLPLVLLYGAILLEALRGRRESLPGAPARVANWTAPVFAIPLIIFTVGVLAADFVKTNSWTLTRQNLDALVGDQDCGLAEDVFTPLPRSMKPLSSAEDVGPRPTPAWIPPAPASNLSRFELRPTGQKSVTSPWFELPTKGQFGLFVAGLPDHSDRLALEWGSLDRGRIVPLGTASVDTARHSIETDPWSFLAASELPRPDPLATAVRVMLSGDTVPGAAVAVTAPVTYENEVLARRLDSGSTLVHPNLLLYFPCAEQPRLDEGVVDPPRHIVWFDHPFQPHPYEPTSTFLGLQDLYEVEQRPTSDSPDPPEGVVVFEVDAQIPGAQIAPPDRTTEVS